MKISFCTFAIACSFFLIHPVFSEIIPDAQRVHWGSAGYPGEIPYMDTNIIDVGTVGAVADGSTDNFTALQTAIDAAPTPAVLYFPPGTYRFGSPLSLKSGIVIRGAGSEQTVLECDSDAGCFQIHGRTNGSAVSVIGGVQKGATQVQVSSATGFTFGEGGAITQLNVATPYYSGWVEPRPIGQMVRIVGISDTTLQIEPPLHRTYNLDKGLTIQPVVYIRNVGIEDLTLKRLDRAASSNNISITRAADSWIRRVESDNTLKYHISISRSLHVEVRDSYIHDAKSKGDGGQGYGVSLASQSTSILVENSIFNELRHAMIVQLGTNGCVFGYNYAQRNYSDDGWDKTYISIHGHYSFMNLYESNIVGLAGIGDYWGPDGPGNTFFRNRVIGTDKHQDFGPYRGLFIRHVDGPQNIVGNEVLGSDGIYLGSDPNTALDDHLIHGNYEKGAVVWDEAIADHTLPSSLYLQGRPAFYGAMAWPSMGADMTINQGTIPAKARFDNPTISNVPQPVSNQLLPPVGLRIQ